MTQFSQGHVAILTLTTSSPRHLPSKQETSEGDSSVQTKELASPAPSPAKVKDRSRDQLLKLPESSARKLKQFDIKYNESKKKVADLVAGSQKLEEENARLQAALDGGGAEATAAAASVAQRSLEEKDDAIRVPSYELTGLQHEHEEKLRAKVEEVLAAEGERDEELWRVDELLVKVSDLEGQLVTQRSRV